MKKLVILSTFLLMAFANSTSAAESKCGRMTGIVWNHYDSPVQGLSGFFVKQSTRDIRITRGSNEDLMIKLEGLESLKGLFICLDDYSIESRSYSGRSRLYGEVFAFRLWQNGNLIMEEEL